MHNSTLYISLMWKDMLGGVVYWTVLCYHPYLFSMLFADLLSLHLVTFFSLVYVPSFSSWCMLEPEFAIYHRAASLSSQASSVDVCNIGWRTTDQALFKHQINNGWKRLSLSACTHPFFKSAILNDIWIFFLTDLCACIQVLKMASLMKSSVFSNQFEPPL